jgi:hypothetical protein
VLSGAAAAAVYVFTVILGGLLRPGYNHLSQAVSELIENGAPNRTILNALFLVYNLLRAGFAVGLFSSRGDGNGKGGAVVAAGIVLLAEAACGFATVFFPQDVPGTAATATGVMHIVLAGLSSLSTMAALLMMTVWFYRVRTFPGYGLYSLVTLILVFVAGGAAALTTARGVPLNGLAERITIGGFIQWVFVLSLRFFSYQRSQGREMSAGR